MLVDVCHRFIIYGILCPDGRSADGVWDGRECQESQSHDKCRSKIHIDELHVSIENLIYWLLLCNFQNNGSVNVHIDLDQPVQSEPRLRLVLAENLLRDINNVVQRMEVNIYRIPETHPWFIWNKPSRFCLSLSGSVRWLFLSIRCNSCCSFFIDQLHTISFFSAYGHLPTTNNSPTSTYLFHTVRWTNAPTRTQVRQAKTSHVCVDNFLLHQLCH